MDTIERLQAEYAQACTLSGTRDYSAAEEALREYVRALGVTREVRRINRGWDLREPAYAPLRAEGLALVKDIAGSAPPPEKSLPHEAEDALRRVVTWAAWHGGMWSGDLDWLAIAYIGAIEKNIEPVKLWSQHVYRAFVTGAWCAYWTEEVLWWVAWPEVRTDERRRLHAEGGPALICDLEDIYAWHGVIVPDRVILRPETITVGDVSAETNAEQRRVMIERMGSDRWLRESGATVIYQDTLRLAHSPATLRALMQDSSGARWLVATDGSTKRVYTLSVPRDVSTCAEAHRALACTDEARLVAES